MHPEEWIELPVCPDRYLISTHGRVLSVRLRRTITPHWANRGKDRAHEMRTMRCTIKVDGSQTSFALARAVLMAFWPPPPEMTADLVPGYLDGDRANCRLSNLIWVPRMMPDVLSSAEARSFYGKIGYANSPAAQAQTFRRREPANAV